jgi:ABC-type cobalt transport system substrate-binding protein
MKNQMHGQMTTFRNLLILCAVCLMAALALPSAASSPAEEEGSERQAPEVGSTDAVATKAMRVIYDPETGEIISLPFRETEVLSAPLAKALTRSADGLWVFELSNGGKGVHLDGRFQHALMVRVNSDGSLEIVCTNHSHEAEDFLEGTTAGAKPAPRDK